MYELFVCFFVQIYAIYVSPYRIDIKKLEPGRNPSLFSNSLEGSFTCKDTIGSP